MGARRPVARGTLPGGWRLQVRGRGDSTGRGCDALVSLPLGTEGAGPHGSCEVAVPRLPWREKVGGRRQMGTCTHLFCVRETVPSTCRPSPVNSASVVILTLHTVPVFPSEATGPAHGRCLHRCRVRFRMGLSCSHGETGQNCVIVSWLAVLDHGTG